MAVFFDFIGKPLRELFQDKEFNTQDHKLEVRVGAWTSQVTSSVEGTEASRALGYKFNAQNSGVVAEVSKSSTEEKFKLETKSLSWFPHLSSSETEVERSEKKGLAWNVVDNFGLDNAGVSVKLHGDDAGLKSVGVSSAFTSGDFIIGGSAQLCPKSGSVLDHQLAVSHVNKSSNHEVYIRGSDKCNHVHVGAYLPSGDVTLGFYGSYHFLDSQKQHLSVGASYKLNGTSTITSKVNSNGDLSSKFTWLAKPWMKVGLVNKLNVLKPREVKTGVQVTFGDSA